MPVIWAQSKRVSDNFRAELASSFASYRRPYDNGGTEPRSANLESLMKDLKYNRDGSIDLYIGAKAPTGFESNYMKTVGDDGWFVYFRLYAPLQPFFDKTFSFPDFERID
jgi:hypothetical protein